MGALRAGAIEIIIERSPEAEAQGGRFVERTCQLSSFGSLWVVPISTPSASVTVATPPQCSTICFAAANAARSSGITWTGVAVNAAKLGGAILSLGMQCTALPLLNLLG